MLTTNFLLIAPFLSAVLFGGYGLNCLLSERMVAEFERYGLARFQRLTGALQVAASLGLLLGQRYRPLLLLSAGGLALMMFLAVATRFRIKDPPVAAIPALVLCLLNGWIFFHAL